jgi:ankyrin repeat protein
LGVILTKISLEKGAEIQHIDYSPLTAAVFFGHLTIVRILLDKGADIAKVDYLDYPIHYTAQFGYSAIIPEHISRGDDTDRRTTQNQMTALHMTASAGNERVVTVLLEHDADVSAQNSLKNTPLNMAVISGHTGIVDLLIRNDASLDQPNYQKYTALHYAGKGKKLDIARCLLEAGAAEEPLSTKKLTPLNLASSYGHDDILSLLIEYGADIHRLPPNLTERQLCMLLVLKDITVLWGGLSRQVPH